MFPSNKVASSDQLKSASRPIIYVCHSLGGIVFKKAMIDACDDYREIWMRSKGVVFLGTPHRGSATATPAELFGNIFNVAWHASGAALFTRGVSTDLLKALKQNSSELLDIAKSFKARSSSLSIATFYEKAITEPLGSVVVDESSAVIGVAHERSSPLFADHREICRFESEKSGNYKHVLASLQQIAEESMKEMNEAASSIGTNLSLDEVERACTAILNRVDVSGDESHLGRPASGTLQWILHDPDYSCWRSGDSPRLLWVTGFSGCGKTILSSYIAVYLPRVLSSSAIVCRFFCSGRIDSHRDPINLLRSLIYQIIIRRRTLVRVVRRASDNQGLQLFDRFDALWNLFLEVSLHKKAGPIFVIIDAIDECEERKQTSIIDRIVQLLESESKAQIRFFMTSRPNTPATYVLKRAPVQHTRLRLEERQGAINSDINLLIQQRLDALVDQGRCNPETGRRLQELLMDKADRTFLWISMVLSLLEMRRLLTSFEDAQKLVEKLPSDLRRLYEHFLESIPEEERGLAGKILRTIVVCARPLCEKEIATILAIDQTRLPGNSLHIQASGIGLEAVQALLGPLVRVFDSKVHLIHQSLKEYLIQLGNESHPIAYAFGVNTQRDHLTIARACLKYLAQPPLHENLFESDFFIVEQSPESPMLATENGENTDEMSLFAIHGDSIFKDQTIMDAERCEAIATYYEFFDYAATYWAFHLAGCETITQQDFFRDVCVICDPQSHNFSNWFRYFWISQGTSEPVPSNVDGLSICCFFGLLALTRRFLEHMEMQDARSSTALYWSSRNGHVSCVEEILNCSFCADLSNYVNNLSPLAVAAQHGSSACLSALMVSGIFPFDEPAPDGRTPLSLAAGGGHEETVRVLLEYEVDVNLPDHSGSPPLFWAVSGNATGVIDVLLTDQRTDVNQVDKKHRNALSWAAAEGYVNPTRRLLRDSRINVEKKDVMGCTPLILAVMGGNLDIVDLLLHDRRVNASAYDFSGRNAISWAAERPYPEVLHLLLKYDRLGADKQDQDGWTPLAWALNAPGYLQNVRTLVRSGLVDINRQDIDGRTPLSFAAGYGYLEITKTLCGIAGVIVDCADNAGRSPLSYAAGAGNLNIVRILLSTGKADVNSKDKEGRTALSRAASGGHLHVIEFLLDIPGIEIGLADIQGRTPLWFAQDHDREDVAAYLTARMY
ncbi:hypothetical protein MPH_12697 [Macrophomina phaseolina MS6]|uniref:Nephrocystin 3-like N-terminal domain-containing protein n=1 Tax=Macrophomina phaseolina (strain MS6) TaxID=1126212 RepID=K2R768_MACPH|nr:hypothetical protein MPH_12697 [Macrophomina phaseolina MS6]